jgi:integrase
MIRIVRSLYEFEPASNIGPAELRQIRRTMLKYGARKNRPWSRQYVNEQISRVKKMYKWLAAEPLIPVTVYQALLLVNGLRCGEEEARETDPVLPVDDLIVDATLQHLPDTVADMVQLQRKTGMRPAEVCSLRPCEVDRSGDVWLYQPKQHKTAYRGRERVIFIGPLAQSILLRYLARDAESYCFSPRDSEAKRRSALCKQGNRPANPTRAFCDKYKVTAYRRAIHRACDKAFPAPEEIEDAAAFAKWQSDHRWSPNQLRHAAATQIRRDFGLEAAQVVLGHSRADVTQIYAERDIAKGLDVARKIG